MRRFLKNDPTKTFLVLVIIVAAFFRLYGLNWDQGHHLHPDERAIVMFTTPLQFPKSLDEFLSPQSTWNPHFFAYGNFPLYLLKIISSLLANFDPLYVSYEKINLVGRAISAIADLGTLMLIYLLAKKLFNQTIGLVASFFYTISVFPIQTAHFYAVDTLLTFFIILTLYQLMLFYEKPSIKNSILSGVLFGFALATKVSAVPLIIAIVLTITLDFILLVIRQPHKPHIWFPHIPRFLKRLIFDNIIIVIATGITFAVLQPYAIIDFQEFWRQSMQQRQMIYDPFTFPYTLQYVGKIPYWHELKNIFIWGQGPILATFSLLGTFYITYKTIKQRNNRTMIILIFFWIYFLVVSKFAVGWMRYMLPLYPLLSLFAAAFFYQLTKLKVFKQSFLLFFIFHFSFFIFILIWPLSFIKIYTKPNTRVLASEWINKNIPPGKTLTVEHWDDGLPLFGGEKYRILTLPLYDPDTTQKWAMVNQQLSQTDYIIIASNRLYVPLMKLTSCNKLPPGRCYFNTAQYYSKLFSGSLGFKKIAEFSVYPKLEIGNWKLEIPDDGADESFTVYDHPKVLIFEKISF